MVFGFPNDLYFITSDEYNILNTALSGTDPNWDKDFVLDDFYGLYFISGANIDDEAEWLIDRDMVHPWVYTNSGQPAVNYPGHTHP